MSVPGTAPALSRGLSYRDRRGQGDRALRHKKAELNRFFTEIEGRALRIAEISVRNRDDALDLVQDAMMKLARRYADKSSAEWPPLFYRILQNGVRDHHRRNYVRNRVIAWFGPSSASPDKARDPDFDPIAAAPDRAARTPEQALQTDSAMKRLEEALHELPERQREVFMLRALEGLDVRETAQAMRCG